MDACISKRLTTLVIMDDPSYRQQLQQTTSSSEVNNATSRDISEMNGPQHNHTPDLPVAKSSNTINTKDNSSSSARLDEKYTNESIDLQVASSKNAIDPEVVTASKTTDCSDSSQNDSENNSTTSTQDMKSSSTVTSDGKEASGQLNTLITVEKDRKFVLFPKFPTESRYSPSYSFAFQIDSRAVRHVPPPRRCQLLLD
jgi:hypothetical protein